MPREHTVHVDRVRCTGHGVCAHLLPGRIRLDEHGYPIVDDPAVGRVEANQALVHCPARALYLGP